MATYTSEQQYPVTNAPVVDTKYQQSASNAPWVHDVGGASSMTSTTDSGLYSGADSGVSSGGGLASSFASSGGYGSGVDKYKVGQEASDALMRAADVLKRISNSIISYTNDLMHGGQQSSSVSSTTTSTIPSSSVILPPTTATGMTTTDISTSSTEKQGFLSGLFHHQTPEEKYASELHKIQEKEAAFEKKRVDGGLALEKALAHLQKRCIDVSTELEKEAIDLEKRFVQAQTEFNRTSFDAEILREKEFARAEKARLDAYAEAQKDTIDASLGKRDESLTHTQGSV